MMFFLRNPLRSNPFFNSYTARVERLSVIYPIHNRVCPDVTNYLRNE